MKAFQSFLLGGILVALLVVGFLLYKVVYEDDGSTLYRIGNTFINNEEKPVPTDTNPAPDQTGDEEATSLGSVAGKLCYPSEGIPPLTLYLQNTSTQAYIVQNVPANTGSYVFSDVPEASYIAFAYTDGTGVNSLGGAYTPAVPCGLSVSCTNHKPLAFGVAAGLTASGIDICDWYGQTGDVPPKP